MTKITKIGSGNNVKLMLICKLCGEASDSYVNILDRELVDKRFLREKILSYLNVEVSSSDLLLICHKCLQKLEKFHNFFLASEKGHLLLKSAINEALFIEKTIIETENLAPKKESSQVIDKDNDRARDETQKSQTETVFFSNIDQQVKESAKISQVNDFDNREILSENSIFYDKYNNQEISSVKTNDVVRNSTEKTNEASEKFSQDKTSVVNKSFHHINEELNKESILFNLLVKYKAKEKSSESKTVLKVDDDLLDQLVRLPCSSCTEIYFKPRDLIDHYKQQHYYEEPLFKCRICGSTQIDLKKFLTHYRNHENDKHTCKVCGKSFKRKWSLHIHAAVHTDTKYYKCDQCDKSYKTINNLKYHKKIHHPANKLTYTCTYCDKSFKTNFILKSHEKLHTDPNNFICNTCGKSFVKKKSLRFHMNIHDCGSQIKCPLCSREFRTEKWLKIHLTNHTVEKPFRCEYCDKAYSKFSLLKLHTRLHTGELPYKCDDCPKRFRFRQAFITHQRQHTGEKPFECKTCEHAFTDFANYNKHMQLKHRKLNVIEKNDELILVAR